MEDLKALQQPPSTDARDEAAGDRKRLIGRIALGVCGGALAALVAGVVPFVTPALRKVGALTAQRCSVMTLTVLFSIMPVLAGLPTLCACHYSSK